MPVMTAFLLRPHFVHDAAVTALKLYSEAELKLIATLAAPGKAVEVRRDEPSFSMLLVQEPRRGCLSDPPRSTRVFGSAILNRPDRLIGARSPRLEGFHRPEPPRHRTVTFAP